MRRAQYDSHPEFPRRLQILGPAPRLPARPGRSPALRCGRIALWTIILLTSLLPMPIWTPGTSGAEEGDDFEAAFSACRKSVHRGKWKDAVDSYRELLDRFSGDARPLQRLRIIEDDLKLCHFRLQYRTPSVAELLGPAVVSLNRGSNKIELDYRGGPVGPRWSQLDEYQWVLDLEFRGDVTLSVDSPGIRFAEEKTLPGFPGLGSIDPTPEAFLSIFVCYDPDDETGYCGGAGVDFSSRTHRYSADATLIRIDQGKSHPLQSGRGLGGRSSAGFSLTRDRKGIRFSNGKSTMEHKDKTYREGCVAVVGVRPDRIRVAGNLTSDCLLDIQADSESRAFLQWMAKNWRRDSHLPKSMLTAIEERSTTAPALLPADADDRTRDELGRMLTDTLFGDDDAKKELAKLRTSLPGLTREYAGLAIAFAEGKYDVAEKKLSELGESAPSSALLGLLRLMRGRPEEASEALQRALAKQPSSMLAYYGLVLLAMREGDPDRARGLLDSAERAGIRSRRLTELCELVYRSLAGPLWTRTYEKSTAQFIVRTNHSERTSRRVAYALESAVESYAKYFRCPPGNRRKSLVYVFATEAGYLRYAGDLNKDLAGSAGAFDPRTGELVLFVPDQDAGFVHTVRHEGFHQFIHRALPDIPIWLNEGSAEFFAAGTKGRFSSRITPGAVHLRRLRILRDALKANVRLTRLEDLFVMSQREFMQKAGIHYAQAWAVVHFLRKGDKAEMETVFDDYVKALRNGASGEEAYTRVLAPVVDEIERGYLAHVRLLIRTHLGK